MGRDPQVSHEGRKSPQPPQTWLLPAQHGTLLSLQCLPFRTGQEGQNPC